MHSAPSKVYREDVLAFAYDCCKANGGTAGVDDQTFEGIEAYGVKRRLDELARELKSRSYQPKPVRRVFCGTIRYALKRCICVRFRGRVRIVYDCGSRRPTRQEARKADGEQILSDRPLHGPTKSLHS